MVVIGYDPGTPPTIAVMQDGGDLFIYEYEQLGVQHPGKTRTGNPKKFWTTSPELLSVVLKSWADADHEAIIGIENVTLMPGQDIASGTPFIGSKYLAIGIAVALGIPYTLVPIAWRSKYRLPGKLKDVGGSLLRQCAMQTFPRHASLFQRAKDHNRADAAMMAHWLKHHGPTLR